MVQTKKKSKASSKKQSAKKGKKALSIKKAAPGSTRKIRKKTNSKKKGQKKVASKILKKKLNPTKKTISSKSKKVSKKNVKKMNQKVLKKSSKKTKKVSSQTLKSGPSKNGPQKAVKKSSLKPSIKKKSGTKKIALAKKSSTKALSKVPKAASVKKVKSKKVGGSKQRAKKVRGQSKPQSKGSRRGQQKGVATEEVRVIPPDQIEVVFDEAPSGHGAGGFDEARVMKSVGGVSSALKNETPRTEGAARVTESLKKRDSTYSESEENRDGDEEILESSGVDSGSDEEFDGEFSAGLEPEASHKETDFKALVAESQSKALAASDPVTRYLSELRKYPLITREEEKRLAILYTETGDAQAAEKLVTSNLRFVVKVAAEYSKFGARLIDLIQEGNVGLMHAVREYNPYKGVRLITYAVWWIRGYIREYLMRQYSMVRIGTTANQRKLFYQLQKQKDLLEREGREAGIAQLSGRLGISEEEISTMEQRMSGRDVSLDQPVGSDGTTRWMDLQGEASPLDLDHELSQQEELSYLNTGLEQVRKDLNERELFLLEARILADEPLTLQEVGDKYSVTREAIRQMEVRLIKKIKKAIPPEFAESLEQKERD